MAIYELIQALIKGLVVFATDFLLPFMIMTFVLGTGLKIIIHFTVKREYWFSTEFNKRVHRFINKSDHKLEDQSFFILMRKLLEVTFYEVFEIRTIMKRRNPDAIMSVMDRIFFIQQGAARLVNDTLRQIRFLKYEREKPRLLDITKDVYGSNPCFNKLFGVIPLGSINDFLNVLPSLFIVGGIFGTFLGIMKALPELGAMNLTDAEASKLVMDTFLLKISFSMSTSIIGIVLSVSMTTLNTFLNTEKLYIAAIEKFEGNMSLIWDICDHNDLPVESKELDVSRDAIEVLGEDGIDRELRSGQRLFKNEKPVRGWWLEGSKNKKTKEEISSTPLVDSGRESYKNDSEDKPNEEPSDAA